MAQELRFTLDGSVYDGVNAENFSITVAEEPTLGYRYVSYDNDLQFTGAAYAYLNGLITGSCGCDLVEVRVDYKCGGTFTMLCTGYIILAECNADLDRCQITTKLYDNTFSTLINNNKSIPFSLRSATTKNGEAITPPAFRQVSMFIPATGVYDTTNLIYGITVEDAFVHLVGCMTDNRVDVVATAFASGDYEFAFVTNGRQIYTPLTQIETVITFEQLFVSLRNKINITLSTTIQSNGRPLLTIDYATNINALPINANLVDVSGVRRKQDTAQLYSTVGLGNREMLEQWQCNNGDTACTFAQTPFFGFREESFGLIGNCNRDTELDLVVNDVVFDTNVIEDIFVWGNQSYDNNPVIINATQGLAGRLVPTQGDPYNIGQTVYNAEFTNLETSANWVNGFPGSLASYIAGFNTADTFTTVKKNDTIAQFFEANNVAFTSFSQDNGTFIDFNSIISDANNNWNNTEYIVPYTGIYTANLLIVRQALLDPLPGDITQNAIIRKLNAQDELVQSVIGPTVIEAVTSFSVCNVTAQFVCEAGDKIVADMQAKSQNGTTVPIRIANGFGSEDTNFGISGVPFEPGDIQPVDPCDYKRYLYDFEYPLTMSDIANIVQQPSAPIRFSRTPTINAGISGTINKMTVQSVVKQMADFTIRSKDIL